MWRYFSDVSDERKPLPPTCFLLFAWLTVRLWRWWQHVSPKRQYISTRHTSGRTKNQHSGRNSLTFQGTHCYHRSKSKQQVFCLLPPKRRRTRRFHSVTRSWSHRRQNVSSHNMDSIFEIVMLPCTQMEAMLCFARTQDASVCWASLNNKCWEGYKAIRGGFPSPKRYLICANISKTFSINQYGVSDQVKVPSGADCPLSGRAAL
jgi:hypothetical protein